MKQKIYLMKNEFGLHKVGISVNPKKRAMDIANNSGVPTEVVSTWESYNAYSTEQRIHKHFSNKRKSGEWFKFSKRDITEVEKYIRDFDKLIPCVVEYTKKSPPRPPCQDLKFMLVRKNKGVKTIEDISAVMEYQHSLLNPIFRLNKVEYGDLITELSLDGLHMPAQWKGQTTCYGPMGNLYKPYCTTLSHSYPICSDEEKTCMEIIYLEEELLSYREQEAQLSARLEKLRGFRKEKSY